MFYEELPAYTYTLPCGHDFRSLTPSEPDDGDGLHWFVCDRHDEITWYGVEDRLLIVEPPRCPVTGRKLGDGELARRVDNAIRADRVATYYRAVWNTRTAKQVATATGVNHKLAERVAARLGVYSGDEASDHGGRDA
jgi:hypothetical protein